MISVVIPAYNEETSVASTVSRADALLKRLRVKHEIIVVNDASTDRTAAVLRRSRARVITHVRNKGYGASLKTGIRKALLKTRFFLRRAAGGAPAAQKPASTARVTV